MGKGILDISIELLQQILLMPEGMTIEEFYQDMGRGQLRIFVEHVDIPASVPGDWLPRVELRYVRQHIDHVALDNWTVVEGYPGD